MRVVLRLTSLARCHCLSALVTLGPLSAAPLSPLV